MIEINNRRSIRTFIDKKIEKEKIEKLLRAAMQAPSSGNQKPWRFVVIEDTNKIQELSTYSPFATSLAKAPLAIVLLGDTSVIKNEKYWPQDMSAATQNILLEATHLQLGAVWLSIFPNKQRIPIVQNIIEVPNEHIPFCVVALGYPKATNANTFIDRFDPSRITYM